MRISIVPLLLVAVIIGACGDHLIDDRIPREPVDPGFKLTVPDYGDRILISIKRDIEHVVGRQASRRTFCRVMPIGAKPCGGPWGHIVYSGTVTNETLLEQFVQAYNDRQAYLNRRDGHGSTCDVVSPPDISLVDGMCTASMGGR